MKFFLYKLFGKLQDAMIPPELRTGMLVRAHQLRFSAQANNLLTRLEKSDPHIRIKIREWFIQNKLVIGGGHIIEYSDKH